MPVTSHPYAVLGDLREHGAEAPFFLEARFGDLTRLFEHGYLVQLDTPAGVLVVPGPKGRTTFGLRANYRTAPEAAADQYVQRRCLALLGARGWTYLGRSGRWPKLLRPEGYPVYLLARWRQVNARSVKRTLERLHRQLVAERATLLVHTDRPGYLMPLAKRSDGLIRLLCLDDRKIRD